MFIAVRFSTLILSSFVLTGCTYSPSLEGQTKIVEYENCLAHNRMLVEKTIDVAIAGRTGAWNSEAAKYESTLKTCEKLRP